jgi:hypothetical protein
MEILEEKISLASAANRKTIPRFATPFSLHCVAFAVLNPWVLTEIKELKKNITQSLSMCNIVYKIQFQEM